jgi:hypothetical protein
MNPEGDLFYDDVRPDVINECLFVMTSPGRLAR